MTRFLRLMCIGGCTAAFAVACGDDDGGKKNDGMEDGGVVTPADLADITGQVTGLEGDLQDLESTVTDGLADLNTGLMGANGDITGLQGDVDDLQGRIADLITPDNCSVEELCIPDGVQATATAITSLIGALCAKEFDCCDENELAVRLGKGVEDEGDCVKRVVDMLENGQSPDIDLFWGGYDILDNAVQIAAAINSNDVQVGIDADKIVDCVATIDDIDCNEEGEEVEDPEFCEPQNYEEETDPCSPDEIVIGLQQEGELCGVTGVDECADGLNCNPVNEEIFTALPGGGVLGICMPPSAVNDACHSDANCNGEEQYCDAESNTCQERGDVDDPCGYVDDTFEIEESNGNYLDPDWIGGWLQNPAALKVECKRGLWCDPLSETCVNNCSEHALCYGDWSCPEDTICNHTEVPELWTMWQLGLCTDPIEEGDHCTQADDPLPNGEYPSTECETGACADIGGDDGAECVPALTEDGGDCDDAVVEPAADLTCASNFCNRDNECATLCVTQDDCPDGFFCYPAESSLSMSVCEPKGDIGDDCDGYIDEFYAPGDNYECESARCAAGLCAAKLANGDVCVNQSDCPQATHFCGFISDAYQCMPYVAEGGDCSTQQAGNLACSEGGQDAYCGNSGTNLGKCADYAGDGDDCDTSEGGDDIRCDADGDDATDESDDLDCITSGVDEQSCHAFGDYPNGAGCDFDDYCDSGFCNNMNGYVCEDPIEGGEDCDADDPTMWRCEDGYFCKHDPDAEGADIGKGECTEQKGVGDGCEPRYDNYGGGSLNVHDCQGEDDSYYLSNQCLLIGDEFVCGQFAYEDSLQCDGN